MFKSLILAVLLTAGSAMASDITAHSWLETDEQGNLIKGENITETRSIASITKLMTVMAVLDYGQNLKEKIGKFTRGQLIQLALVKSDNNAAKALCNNFPGGNFACVKYMNEKAEYLGMNRTRFVEPTGLSPMNISTALELVRLVNEASRYPEIVKASSTSTLTLRSSKKKSTTVRNTNPMISKYNFLVSKTGTTNAAGHCIVMMLDTGIGRRIVIVLGSKPGKRIFDAEKIALNA
jgi:D-alanyl-D-alanine endopeptidase (penicillin-binding protein 7)